MITHRLIVRIAGVAAAGLVITVCGDPPTPPPPVVPVAAVIVSPDTATREAGLTLQLSALLQDSSGAALDGREITWTSSKPGVATVDGSGLVTAVASGQATITAQSEGKFADAVVTVWKPEVLVGAGDIAECGSSGHPATAALLDNIPGTVFTSGDNAYPSGSDVNYANCYHSTWGRHRARTRPAPGNHEYLTPEAAGYFNYYGPAAGERGKGYYSYELGMWHVIVLNSNIPLGPGSAQDAWLRADLAATSRQCVAAYWHHPRFNSGMEYGNMAFVSPFWDALYEYGADVVIVGHEHVYERFAPQRPNGTADPATGIRQFTVGTGGGGTYAFGTPVANSQARHSGRGVLKLTLRDVGYDWEFISVPGESFTDSGSGTCHGRP
jgi:hypothetical protein